MHCVRGGDGGEEETSRRGPIAAVNRFWRTQCTAYGGASVLQTLVNFGLC